MRRLVLGVPEKELSKLGIDIPSLDKIKSLELLQVLRQDSDEFAAIWRVELKDAPSSNLKDLLANGFLAEGQLLEQEESGAYTVFMKVGPVLSSVLDSIGADGYLFPPLGIRDGKIKMSFLGSERQVRNFLEKIGRTGIRYKVVLLADASFSPDSPLNQLTEKQRKVLVAAYELGYYDIPRKINSDGLAKKLKMANSTLVEHIRKAEQRLLAHILTEKSNLGLDKSKPED
jgi:hypothetical protein